MSRGLDKRLGMGEGSVSAVTWGEGLGKGGWESRLPARRGTTAYLAAGRRLRIACTTLAARALHIIISGDDHGQALAYIATHIVDRALR